MLSYYNRLGQPISPEIWEQLSRDPAYKKVAGDRIVTPDGDAVISTVWLGIDHSFGFGKPLIFETMIFGGPADQYQDRYSTLAEAEAGHKWVLGIASRGAWGELNPDQENKKDTV